MRFIHVLISMITSLLISPSFATEKSLTLRDGERIVLVGSTFIEREQSYGYWETAIRLQHPGKHLIIRNLGWSGDTVHGDARAGFKTVEVGFQRLRDKVLEAKPTLIVLGYGTNESFAGESGLQRFKDGYDRLLKAIAPAKARIVLLSPLPQEKLGAPLPDPSEQNQRLALYTETVQGIAKKHRHRFVDLYHPLYRSDMPEVPMTNNGIHLTGDGYQRTISTLFNGLGWKWNQSKDVFEKAQVKKLRSAIIEKNRLFFHHWRPQNVTYLFGFRKHEQGQNAKEVAEFLPLIEKADKAITELTKREGGNE